MNINEVAALFTYEHLPPHLKEVSQSFHSMAMQIVYDLPPSAERTLCLRKLWEAKNLAVWCAAQEVKA